MKRLLLAMMVVCSCAGGVSAGAGVNHVVEGVHGLGIFDVIVGIAAIAVAQIANYRTKGFKYFGDKEA